MWERVSSAQFARRKQGKNKTMERYNNMNDRERKMGIYFFVGLGGALGAIARILVARAAPSFLFGVPLAIFCVNVIGCFALGVLTEIFALYWNASLNARHFLIQGFLGGFTTFSAFSMEF